MPSPFAEALALSAGAAPPPTPDPLPAPPGPFASALAYAGSPALLNDQADQGQRVQALLKTRAAVDHPWSDVADSLRRIAPGVNPDDYKAGYEADRMMTNARRFVADAGENQFQRIASKAFPFASGLYNLATGELDAAARKRIAEGKGKPDDFLRVAANERLAQINAGKGIGAKLTDVVIGLPALVTEAAVTGKIGGQGATVPGFAGRQAVRGAVMPSLFAERAVQNAEASGGAPTDFSNLAPAVALGAAQNVVLGSLGKVAGKVPTVPLRIGARTATGLAEQQAVDVAASGLNDLAKATLDQNLNLDTKYGTVGRIINSEEGAWKDAAVQALTFAVFSGMHEAQAGGPRQPTAAEPQGYRNKKAGAANLVELVMAAKEAGVDPRDILNATRKMDAALKNNRDPREAIDRSGQLPKPVMDFEEALAGSILGPAPAGELPNLGVGGKPAEPATAPEAPQPRPEAPPAPEPAPAPESPPAGQPEPSSGGGIPPEPVSGSGSPPPPRRGPREPFRSEGDLEAESLSAQGFSREQIDYLRSQNKVGQVDEGIGYQAKGAHEPTIRRAIEHVRRTGESAHYAEIDLKNLGGLNAKLGFPAATKVFRDFGQIIREELAKTGADVQLIRHGGDEVSAVVVNGSREAVEQALAAAQERVRGYVKENGLDQIEHPKYKGQKDRRGTGITYAVADIGPHDTVQTVHEDAAIRVEQNKIGGQGLVERRKNEEVGTPPPEGQAPGVGEGATRPPQEAPGGAAEAAPRQEVAAPPEPAPAPKPNIGADLSGGEVRQLRAGELPRAYAERLIRDQPDPVGVADLRAIGVSQREATSILESLVAEGKAKRDGSFYVPADTPKPKKKYGGAEPLPVGPVRLTPEQEAVLYQRHPSGREYQLTPDQSQAIASSDLSPAHKAALAAHLRGEPLALAGSKIASTHPQKTARELQKAYKAVREQNKELFPEETYQKFREAEVERQSGVTPEQAAENEADLRARQREGYDPENRTLAGRSDRRKGSAGARQKAIEQARTGGYAHTGPVTAPGQAAGQATQGPSPHEIVKTIADVFKIPVSTGRTTQNANAYYQANIRSLEVSGRMAGNVSVAVHELAHHLTAEYHIPLDPGQLPAPVVRGLAAFDYDPTRPMGPEKMHEGFAEATRALLEDPSTPKFGSWTPDQKAALDFTQGQLKRTGRTKDLERISDLIQQNKALTPQAQAQGQIAPSAAPTKPLRTAGEEVRAKSAEIAGKMQELFDDRLKSLSDLELERRRIGMAPSAPGRDLRSQVAAASLISRPLSDKWILDGVTSFTKDASGSWRESKIGQGGIGHVLEGFSPEDAKPGGFVDTFLQAHDSLNEVELGKQLIERGAALEQSGNAVQGRQMKEEGARKLNTVSADQLKVFSDFLAHLESTDRAKFDRAVEMHRRYTAFFNDMLRAEADAGWVSQKYAQEHIARFPTYVPKARVLDVKFAESDAGKARHGSGRQLVSPMLMMKLRAEEAARNVNTALLHDALWQSGVHSEGPAGVSSYWKERPPETQPLVGEARRKAEEALLNAGYSQQEAQALMADLGSAVVHYDKPAPWSASGHNYLHLRVGGQTKTIEVGNKPLYEIFSHQQGNDTRLVSVPRALASVPGLAQATAVLKGGATSVSMVFNPRNVTKDPWHYFQNAWGKDGFLPALSRLVSGQWEAARAGFEKARGKEITNPIARLYHEFSGEGERALGFAPRLPGAAAYRKATGQTTPLREAGIAAVNKVKDVLEFWGAGEHGPRLAEWTKALKDLGYTRAKVEAALRANPHESPIPLDALVYARTKAAEATVDFSRQGSVVHEWNKIAPFFGAHMAGMSQEVRNWNTAIRAAASGKVTPKVRAMAATTALYVGLELAHWWNLRHEDWYDELPEHLRNNWWVLGRTETGGVWGVPKPQGMLRMLGAALQEGLRVHSGNNPLGPGKTLWNVGYEQAAPRVYPIGVGEGVDVISNRSWAGRPIVPDRENPNLHDWDQWVKYRFPYILEQLTGGLASQRGLRTPETAFEASQAPPHKSVDDYFSRLHELEKEHQTHTRNRTPNPNAAEYRRYHAVQEKMESLSREVRGEKKIGGSNRVVGPPTKERRDEIRRQQLEIARKVVGRSPSIPDPPPR